MLKRITYASLLAMAGVFAVNAEKITVNTTAYDATREVDKMVCDGVQYINVKIPAFGNYGASIHVTIVDLTNPNVHLEMINAGGTTSKGTATLDAMATRETSAGHKVVAGANANFWVTSETPRKYQLYNTPFGFTARNGVLITEPNNTSDKHCGGPSRTGCVAVTPEGKVIIESFSPTMNVYHYDRATRSKVAQCNRIVRPGEICMYNEYYPSGDAFKPIDPDDSTWPIVTGQCTEVLLDFADGVSWNCGGDMDLVVRKVRTNAGTGTRGSYPIALVGRDDLGTEMAAWQAGDVVRLRTKYDFEVSGVQQVAQAVSGNVMVYKQGVFNADVVEAETYNTNWYGRTLYGVSEDGTKFYMLVCENKSGTITGMTSKQLGQVGLHFGAWNMTQADGGGSAQMWVDGSQVSVSTDAAGVRAVNNGMFVVYTGDGEPYVNTDLEAHSFGEVKVGESQTYKFHVDGHNLTSNIKLVLSGTNKDEFSLSKSSIAQATASGDITVTFTPTSAGSKKCTVNIKLNDAVYTKAQMTGTAIDDTPVTPGGIKDDITTLTEVWNYSDVASNLSEASWFSKVSPASRDLTVKGDRLYVLNSTAWNSSPVINILNAYTATPVGTLSVDGISGGETILASIKAFDGAIIGSNGARVADVLKVYKWDDDSAAPELWFSDSSHGGVQVGELMSVDGDMSNGRIIFANAAQAVIYNVSGGTVSTTPQVIPFTKNGEAYNIDANKGSCDIAFMPDGTFWASAKGKYPTHFAADGSYIEELASAAMGGLSVHGAAARFFQFGNKTYAAAMGYLALTSSTLSEGAMALIDITDGAAAAVNKGVYPSNGLGTVRNTLFQNTVAYQLSNGGSYLNLWELTPSQGIAMYSYDGSDNTGVQLPALSGDPDAPARYYNLQGAQVDAERLTPGVYIKVSGGKAVKIVKR